jgi:hypothetical protein
MANLTFPSNPVNGQKFTSNGKLFAYDSSTQRWSVTRVQLLGSLPDDVTLETPDLTLDNTAISFSATGTTVYVHYTVSDDVSVSIANNGLANTDYAVATLSRSNNTITITSGATEFSTANVVVTATNNRTSNTASIDLSAAYGGSFEISNLVAYAWDNSTTGGKLDTNQTTQGGGFLLEAEDYVHAVTVSDDGLKMWFANGANGRIHQITLSQKILNRYGTYVTSLDKVALHPANTFRSGVEQIEFNGDGTKVFVLREGQYASLYEYSLSTAYDISTAVNANGINRLTAVNDALVAEFGAAYGGGSYIAGAISFRFINNGNGFTLVNLPHQFEAIHQFTLSTPYDLSSTITYQKGWYTDTSTAATTGWATDPNIDHIPGFSGNEIYPYDFMYNKSGTKALALISDSTTSGGGFAEWTFSTPFDLTTATNNVYPTNAVPYAWSFATNSLADTLYIGLDNNEYIQQYAWS